jgi:hypothetical protein
MTIRVPGWLLAALAVIAAGALGAGIVLLIAGPGGTDPHSAASTTTATTSTVEQVALSVQVSGIGLRIARFCRHPGVGQDQAVRDLETLIGLARRDPEARLTSKTIPTVRAALVEVQTLLSLRCDPVLAMRAKQAVDGLPG